jgi:outer membrane protein OmpA-like peptidoglycan-associated protein
MKRTYLLFVLLYIGLAVHAQTLGERAQATAKQKTGDRMDQSINNGIDSSVNKAGRAIGNLFKKKPKKTTGTPAADPSVTGASSNIGGAGSGVTGGGANAGGAYGDFVPGANVLMDEHFDKDALLDFPAQWNTNGSGKVVNLDGQQGKWLDIAHNSLVNPVLNKALPENCTIGFDLFMMVQGDQITPTIQFGLTAVSDILKEDIAYKDKFFVNISRYNENDGHSLEYGLKDVIGNKNDFPLLSYAGRVLHFDIAINKTRIRVYADQVKLIDLPRALTPAMRNNFYIASMSMVPAPQIDVLAGNIRIASAETDARSLLVKQLLEDGKAVTNDILFDVNSDVIKASSYSIIDQVGTALQQNPSVRILILGHTDSDGAAAHNMDLSQRRASAVKTYIMTHFSIDDSRIQSDGKGATQPVAPNTTDAGKAKNRRVEFVKL